MSTINVTSAPKTATFQMRINPEVKQRVEEIYARQGLSFTDAVNIFIQQSLNMEGLPFLGFGSITCHFLLRLKMRNI